MLWAAFGVLLLLDVCGCIGAMLELLRWVLLMCLCNAAAGEWNWFGLLCCAFEMLWLLNGCGCRCGWAMLDLH